MKYASFPLGVASERPALLHDSLPPRLNPATLRRGSALMFGNESAVPSYETVDCAWFDAGQAALINRTKVNPVTAFGPVNFQIGLFLVVSVLGVPCIACRRL